MDQKIEVGDVVQLAGGGPPMTVVGFNDDGDADCMWFNRDHEAKIWSGAYYVTVNPAALRLTVAE